MPYIEMKDLSEKNNDSVTEERIYNKFPFFIGNKIKLDIKKINYDFKTSLASKAYKSQSIENLSKPVKRFWNSELTLANLCCEAITTTLLNDPAQYKNRSNELPEELNDAINNKLNEVENGIFSEKISSISKLKFYY